MIRVSTQHQYNTSIDNMQRSNVTLDKLQQQISTGKRILQPSDDPVAAAQVVKLERELAQYDKYDTAIKVTDRRLTLQESVMDSMRNSLNRVNEFVIKGSTGTLTDADRASIAVSLTTEADFMASLMNTQDGQGEYIFAGSKGNTKPYAQQIDGSFDYQGDDGQRSIKVSSELSIPSNDSGEYLFEAVSSDLVTTVKGSYSSLPLPAAPLVSNVTFENQAAQDEFSAATKGLGDLTISVNAAGTSYSVTDSSANPVNDANGAAITNIAYPAPGDKVNLFGKEFDLAVPPVAATAGELTNVMHTEAEQQNILDIVQIYAKALKVPQTDQTSRDDFAAATLKMFGQWEQASERNIESVTRLGTRLNFLEKVKDSNLDFTLFAQTSLSSIQDVNMPEAISKFKLEEVTLEASQAVFGRVAAMSLFDNI